VSPPRRQALEFVEKYEAGSGRRRPHEHFANIGFASADVLGEQLRALEELVIFVDAKKMQQSKHVHIRENHLNFCVCAKVVAKSIGKLPFLQKN
jgi:hypothetical protein